MNFIGTGGRNMSKMTGLTKIFRRRCLNQTDDEKGREQGRDDMPV
jgi:hypothetical protein